MTPDHEAAKKWAEKIVALDEIKAQQPEMVAFSRAYLDAMARLDKATELLRDGVGIVDADDWDAQTTQRWLAGSRAFLATDRK